MPTLHQFTVGAMPGDAITDQALTLRDWLRAAGYQSELFADFIHPSLEGEVRPPHSFRPRPGEQVLFHHSTGSAMADRLLALPVELILIYHNITPPEFFAASNPALAQEMARGYEQLAALRPRTVLALADSAYNERGLHEAGYTRTGVLPITLDEARYHLPPDPAVRAWRAAGGPVLLFVGRVVPNKRQEDLLKLLYHVRRIDPTVRLALVGQRWEASYVRWVEGLARDLGLSEALHLTDHVSQQAMVSYFREADLYVSMSEHEGFGKPLIESMYLDLPVLAFAATGVPYTMGEAGVLLHHKHWEAAAELVHLLLTDAELRATVVAGQRRRVQHFLAPQVRATLFEALHALEA